MYGREKQDGLGSGKKTGGGRCMGGKEQDGLGSGKKTGGGKVKF